MSNWNRTSTLIMIPKTKDIHYRRMQCRINELRVCSKNPILIEVLNFIEEPDEAIAGIYLDGLKYQEHHGRTNIPGNYRTGKN